MNAAPEASSWLWLASLLAVLLVAWGGYLARTGFAGRRRGDVPHCARCDYIVGGGLEQLRCPECGSDLGVPGAIVHGERQRRRGRGVAGLAVALLGLALGAAAMLPQVRQVDWYRYRPGSWVVRDFKSMDPARSDRAWAELNRRGMSGERWAEVADVALDRYAADPARIDSPSMLAVTQSRGRLSAAQRERLFAGLLAGLQAPAAKAKGARDVLEAMVAGGELGDAQHGRLTELALAEQAAEKPQSPEAGWLLTYLGDRELAGALTDAQRERFYLQAHAPGQLTVRQMCVAGDRVPFRYKLAGRGPEAGAWQEGAKIWWVSTRTDRIVVDGKTYAEGGGTSGSTGFGHGTSGSSIDGLPPGKHTLEILLTIAVYHGPQREVFADRSKPRWTREVKLSAEFEVLAEAPPGLVEWVDDPAAAAAVRAGIKPRDLERRPPNRGLDLMIEVNKVPHNIAFDVIGRAGDTEFPIGTLAASSGYTGSFGMAGYKVPPLPDDRVDVILRSSEAALRGTVDLFDAWRGEIVFEGLPVKQR